MSPINTDITNLISVIYMPTNWTGAVIVNAGYTLGVAVNNYLDQAMAMFNVNDN